MHLMFSWLYLFWSLLKLKMSLQLEQWSFARVICTENSIRKAVKIDRNKIFLQIV